MLSEYSFARITIDLMSLNQEDAIRVYEQQILIDHLLKQNPKWFSQIIAILNDLEMKNGK